MQFVICVLQTVMKCVNQKTFFDIISSRYHVSKGVFLHQDKWGPCLAS
jgi:hypothetical protein